MMEQDLGVRCVPRPLIKKLMLVVTFADRRVHPARVVTHAKQIKAQKMPIQEETLKEQQHHAKCACVFVCLLCLSQRFSNCIRSEIFSGQKLRVCEIFELRKTPGRAPYKNTQQRKSKSHTRITPNYNSNGDHHHHHYHYHAVIYVNDNFFFFFRSWEPDTSGWSFETALTTTPASGGQDRSS